MPRKAKPYVHQGWYCTSFGGVPHRKLCREAEGKLKADTVLARLMAEDRGDTPRFGALPVDESVLEDWIEAIASWAIARVRERREARTRAEM